MKLKLAILFCFILFFRLIGYAQEIKVEAKQESLNRVLIDLRDKYNVQFSFNDDLLSQFSITASKNFSNIEDAIKFLLKNTALQYQYSGEVFLIYQSDRKKLYHLNGYLYDFESREALPFSHVTINDIPQVSDVSGGFSFTSESDIPLHLKASHLGYFILDTVLSMGPTQKLYLHPAKADLPEILVSDRLVQNFIKIGNEPGHISLNHKIVNFLPGNGDNSVFELLRMQPGISASNEQSDRVIIWGSYEGETQVLFDKITLWGLKNTFEDIGDINPLIAKHIDIKKGAYDAQYDGRVGGIVNITGKNGNRNKAALTLCMSNVTANASMELPIGKRSSLLAAYRQTYYNLYSDESVVVQTRKIEDEASEQTHSVVTPSYKFRDMNLKYAYTGVDGDAFYVSFIRGTNDYAYRFDQSLRNHLKKSREKRAEQLGASLFYSKQWQLGGKSELFMASSAMNSEVNSLVELFKIRRNSFEIRRNDLQKDQVFEYKAGLRHALSLSNKYALQMGITYLYHKLDYSEDALDVNQMEYSSDFNRVSAFAQSKMSVNKKLSFKMGANLNYPSLVQEVYIDPRLSVSYKLTESVSINSAWGLYRQFMSRSLIWNEEGNRRNFWLGSDNKNIPVLRSEHFVIGSNYHKNDFSLSIEAYHKFTKGHTRYFRTRRFDGLTTGKSQSYGLDFYLKKNINKHAFWLAYNLGRTEEKFERGRIQSFQRALQDQTQELKLSGLVNVGRFYCSANYIWASGFPLYKQQTLIVSEPDYSRLDASIIYKMKPKKLKAEFGLMFLNIFDNDNINYFNSERVNVGQETVLSINEKTTPFSVRLFLKLGI